MWNFRLVKHIQPKSRSVWYGVHEVFYNDAGKPWTMTEEPVQVDGESTRDIIAYLEQIIHDLSRLPVLDAGRSNGLGHLREYTEVAPASRQTVPS